jgi:hypothetical protein
MASWYPRKYSLAQKKIKRLEKVYGNPRIVYLFVREELMTTRSPGKKAALTEWIQNNPKAVEGFQEWYTQISNK